MNSLKALGTATAVAATGLLLLFSSSASATALCKTNTNPCPQAEIYASNSKLKAKLKAPAAKLVLTTTIEKVECEASEITGKWQTDGSGEYTTGEVSVLEIVSAKCEALGVKKKCTKMEMLHLPYAVEASATGGGNGTVTLVNGGSGLPALEVVCGNINCTLTANSLPLTVAGGGPAIAELKGSGTQFQGTKCPTLLFTVEAEYEVTEPTPPGESLFIESAAAPPVLCKANQIPCVGGNIIGVPAPLKAAYSAAAKFKYTYLGENKEPTCNFSKFEGETTAAGKPIVGEFSLSFETCAGGACNVTAEGGPYKLEIDRAGGGNGTMTWRKLSGSEPTFKIKCGLQECVYKATSIGWTITGSATAPTFATSGGVGLTGSSIGCSSTATWEGVGGVAEVKYKFTAPTALFVTS